MAQTADASGRHGPSTPSFAAAASASALTTLVYRSRAAQPFTNSELLALTKAAQDRNRAASVTGLMLYDDDCFFQWLEGPDDSLADIMRSIRNDTRHTAIEVIARQQTRQRTFAGWDMKLALPESVPAPWTREVIRPSRETVETLRRRPEIAAAVLERLAPGGRRPSPGPGPGPGARPEPGPGPGPGPRPGRRRTTASLVEQVVRAQVIPQLARRHRQARTAARSSTANVSWKERASSLADILLTGTIDDAAALVHPWAGIANPLAPLFEAAARSLGDRWMQDDCTDLDVTLGLCALQTLARRLERGHPLPAPACPARTALVVPHPGEPHLLTAALAAHTVRAAGWSVDLTVPPTVEALDLLLAAKDYDTLHVSLSPAFRRDESLAPLARTIAQARKASRNAALRITVAGRLFTEQPHLAAQAGADTRDTTGGGAPR